MLEILDLDDAGWSDAWDELPESQKDVFARPAYYRAFSLLEPSARAQCAVLHDDRGLLVYPFFRRSLAELAWLEAPVGKYDVMTAYGYGGIYGNIEAVGFLDDFLELVGEYCRNSGIIVELIRLNPLLDSHSHLACHYSIQTGNQQVVVDLQRSDEDIWRSYRHNNRKNVQKALRSGIEIVYEEGVGQLFGEFQRIYAMTMERRHVTEYFQFSREFFETLAGGLGTKAWFFHALREGKVVSTELALASETALYSFLGGTDEEYYSYRPANLLKHEMILRAREAGLSCFLLGGGSSGKDGIFEFKRSFAPDGIIEFNLAWRVHDKGVYSNLISKCMLHPPQSEEAAAAYPLRWRYGS